MDMATIKGVVDRLVKRGLVHTEPDPADARRLVLTLTAEGDATVDRNLSIALEISQETLSTLTPAETDDADGTASEDLLISARI